jgi:hypothetical protein
MDFAHASMLVLMNLIFKKENRLGLVVRAYNPRTQEVEIGRSWGQK